MVKTLRSHAEITIRKSVFIVLRVAACSAENLDRAQSALCSYREPPYVTAAERRYLVAMPWLGFLETKLA